MQLVINASKWVVKEAENEGVAVTRLFNKAGTIEDKLIPWIYDYTNKLNDKEQESLIEKLDFDSQPNDKIVNNDQLRDEVSITLKIKTV